MDIENPQATDGSEGKNSNKTVLHPSDSSLSDNSQFCAICLCEYTDTDEVCISRNPDCSHFFHVNCGIAWLAKHSQCPICRAEYLLEQEAPSCHLNGESETFSHANGGTTTNTDSNSTSFEIESTTGEGHDDERTGRGHEDHEEGRADDPRSVQNDGSSTG